MSQTENITIVKGSYGYQLQFTLKDSDGNARDMSGYTAKIQAWSPLVPATLTLDKACTWIDASLGTLYYTVASGDFNTIGVYAYQILCTAGAPATISEPALSGFITVTQYGGNYCTLAEVKAQLDIEDDKSDAMLQSNISQVKVFIDKLAMRQFDAVAETRYFDGADKVLFLDDLSKSPTSIKLDLDGDGVYEVTLAATDYMLYPLNTWPKSMAKIGTLGSYSNFALGVNKGVEIAGTFGYPSVPEPIREAAIIQVCRWFKRRESAYQDAVGSAETGEIMVYKGLDPDVKLIIQQYAKTRERFA